MTKEEYKKFLIEKIRMSEDVRYKFFNEFCKEAVKAIETESLTKRDKQFIEYGEYFGLVLARSFIESDMENNF